MANTTTSGESAAAALTGAELVRAVQSAANVKTTTAAIALFDAATVTVASATTPAIGAAAARTILMTGTTTVTGFDTVAAGIWRRVRFSGAVLLTYNATSLILPTSANITTAADDTAVFLSLGSGNWMCVDYSRKSGSALVSSAFTGGTLTSALNEAPTVTIASAATVNIGAAAGNSILVSGTTTITAFDTIAAGAMRRIRFSGILTLTYNATSLILPTSANITTAADDVAEFLSLGSGNWICTSYTRKSGSALVSSGFTGGTLTSALNEAPTVTIASSATPAIGAAAGNTILLTGTVTVTGFDTIAAGAMRRVRFGGILTLTYNATNLILPTSANITTAADDVAEFLSLGSGNWICTNYARKSGASVSGGGSGTVTATGGSLTANAVVLGAGSTDTKVIAGVTTDGTSALNLGVAGSSVGKVVLANATSGTITMQPPTGALGSVTITVPAATDTLVGKATTDILTNKTLTSPTMTAPVLGTPASGNLSSCTSDGTNAPGFREIPQNSKSAAYTTVLADSGKHIYHPSADTTARIFTIDSNANVAYPVGTAITFINDTSAGVATIAITSDTMILAGAGTTGSRTLAANGIATAIKMTSTRWIISGTGLT